MSEDNQILYNEYIDLNNFRWDNKPKCYNTIYKTILDQIRYKKICIVKTILMWSLKYIWS